MTSNSCCQPRVKGYGIGCPRNVEVLLRDIHILIKIPDIVGLFHQMLHLISVPNKFNMKLLQKVIQQNEWLFPLHRERAKHKTVVVSWPRSLHMYQSLIKRRIWGEVPPHPITRSDPCNSPISASPPRWIWSPLCPSGPQLINLPAIHAYDNMSDLVKIARSGQRVLFYRPFETVKRIIIVRWGP